MLDLIYGQVVAARRRWYERHPEARRRLQQPVVSVGNLTLGGTGKTPLVSVIVEWLISRGERPAVLSRGYGRRVRAPGVVVVSDGRRVVADLDAAGDEPLMLARALPSAIVAVCEDRHLAGALAERRLGATVHVLDDGFQHVALARDLDIVVTSPGEIANGRVLPFGRLRERADAAARAHAVVVVGADEAAARSEAWTLGVSQFVAARRVLRVPPHAAAVLVAGIGNARQFFDSVAAAGVDVRATRAFPDHHRYTAKDVAAIDELRRTAGADVVWTTAKDSVRFERAGTLPFPLEVVAIALELTPAGVLPALVEEALARRRAAA